METVLVVSYHFPPEESSCSEKNIRLVKLLLDNGYKVVVLTKPGQGEFSFTNENLILLRTSSAGMFHKQVGSASCSTPSATPRNIKTKIKKWISLNVIPDGTVYWYIPAKKTINENSELLSKTDIILSISSPYSAHFVSHYASKKFKIPYIMSYGDPWIYEPKRRRGWFRYPLEKYLEARLLRDSSKVLLITEWNKRKYQELYNLPSEKVMTFNIGYDNDNVLDILPVKSDKYRILYGGSLDPVHRDPQPFLEAMQKIDNVESYIYCNDNPSIDSLINKYNIDDRVFHQPLIKSSEFNRLMYDFDALLLFGNKTPFQVPGKVFTYIAAKKMIIYIKNNDFPDDGTEEVLKKYGNMIIVHNNSDDIVNCLTAITKEGKSIESKPEVFEYHNTMKSTISAIEDVLGE